MNKNNNKGITLIEVLIALTIASIIVMTMFSAMSNVVKFNAKNNTDVDSRSTLNTITENITSYIKENGVIGIKGNNGHFTKTITNNKNIVVYTNQIEGNDKIEFFEEKDFSQNDISKNDMDFKVIISKENEKKYTNGPFNKEGKFLYEFKVVIEPLKNSDRAQSINKKVYGPIE